MARRLPVVIVLVALVAAAFAVDPRRPAPAATSGVVAAASLSPLATDTTAQSSTWFCAGGSASVTGPAEHTITIANPLAVPAAGTLQLFVEGGEPRSFPVEVGAQDQTRIVLATLAQGDWAAALVELDHGGVVVSHEVLGVGGWDSDRCSSQASDRWYLPWGQTAPQEASSLRLALFNPFAVEAVVDISFDTDDGFRSPEALQGFLVPPRRLVTVDVTNIVPVRLRVSTEVVARSGRLVVAGLQSLSGVDGTVTLDVTPAAPSAATSWYFADGRVDADTLERIAVYNPSDATAQVEVEVSRARTTRDQAIEPFELQLAPQSYAEVVLNDESRIPKPLRHTTVVRTLNDVPVVAERVQLSSTVKDATATAAAQAAEASAASSTTVDGAPAATTTTAAPVGTTPSTQPDPAAAAAAGLVPLPPGLAATLGSPVVARSWVLPDAARPDAAAAKLVVANVSNDQPASFTVRLYQGGAELTAASTAPVTTAPPTTVPATTAPPATTVPATTAPPATAPGATVAGVPASTAPTTAPPSTAPPSTAPPSTAPPSTAAVAPTTTPAGPTVTALEPRQQVEVPLPTPAGGAPVLAVVEATGVVVVEGVQIYGPLADVAITQAVPLADGVRVPDALDPDIGIGEEAPASTSPPPGATSVPPSTGAPATSGPATTPTTVATSVPTTTVATSVPTTAAPTTAPTTAPPATPAPTTAPPATAPPDPSATTAAPAGTG